MQVSPGAGTRVTTRPGASGTPRWSCDPCQNLRAHPVTVAVRRSRNGEIGTPDEGSVAEHPDGRLRAAVFQFGTHAGDASGVDREFSAGPGLAGVGSRALPPDLRHVPLRQTGFPRSRKHVFQVPGVWAQGRIDPDRAVGKGAFDVAGPVPSPRPAPSDSPSPALRPGRGAPRPRDRGRTGLRRPGPRRLRCGTRRTCRTRPCRPCESAGRSRRGQTRPPAWRLASAPAGASRTCWNRTRSTSCPARRCDQASPFETSNARAASARSVRSAR